MADIYGTQDDIELRQYLADVAKSLFCTNGSQLEWESFFNNPYNMQGIKEARAKYGLPNKNRESWRSGGLFGKWTNYCDWKDVFRFFYYAKLSQDYPNVNPQNKQNCYTIDGYLNGLEQERVNVAKQYAITNDVDRYKIQMEVISEKINDYNSLYSSMICNQYISAQDRLISQQERANALKQSQEINVGTFQQTAGVSGGGTKIALYIFGGAAALVGIMLFAAKKSKIN
jgi:hypothetical protein